MAGEDPAWIAELASMTCLVCPLPSGPPHHSTAVHKGMSRRAHDHDAMPLCHEHHMALHALNGYFKGWTKERLHQWQREQVARLRRPPEPGVF